MLPHATKSFNFGKQLTPEEALKTYFPGYTNPDRFAVISEAFDEKNRNVYIKIHGSFTNQAEAEAVSVNAMNNGYPITTTVCDTRSWLGFPIKKVGKLAHANTQLTKIIGSRIEKENAETEEMYKRVERSKQMKPTTAFGRYEQLVFDTAAKMIEDLKDEKGNVSVNLKERFENFRDKELKKLEHTPVDPVLREHFKQKILKAKQNEHKRLDDIKSAGLGMPKLLE
jgi:hypothetical protein